VPSAHDAVLALVGLDVTWQGDRPTEVPAETRLADLVWEAQDRAAILTLLHIELQDLSLCHSESCPPHVRRSGVGSNPCAINEKMASATSGEMVADSLSAQRIQRNA